MTWRPLSLRDEADARFDEPSEGLPVWLHAPVTAWVERAFCPDQWVRVDALTSLQLAFRLEPPLSGSREWNLLQDLLGRMRDDDDFALDVLDWMVHHFQYFGVNWGASYNWVAKLNDTLREGGSAWEVTSSEDGRTHQLTRRAVGPVVEVLEHTATEASRAHTHLAAAWSKLTGRNPDPSGAYREAVRAVEAVAKPVVLPSNDRATLGQMIPALKDKPEKWTTTIGTVDSVRTQMEAVWQGQLDRHGTDDESVPLSVSPEQADAAFSTCLNLVRQFVGGHVARIEND